MKIRNRSKLPKRGYAALFTTLSLSLTIMAFAITAFRETRQSHRIQSVNQVKLDYSQKERAFLRALLHVVPNKVMGGMMPNARNNAADYAWPAIFEEALAQAQTDQSLDPNLQSSLGISANVVSANTGDATFLPAGMITAPNGSRHFALDDVDWNRPSNLNLPPRMRYVGGGGGRRRSHPIVSLNKTVRGSSAPFEEMPYPEIAFGYAEQGATFIARRNWWAFTVNFGATTAATTGIAPSPRTYLLSIYEVPSQLAVSSAGATTSLGKFDGGTDWDPSKISISGNIYADRARIEDLSQVGSVASRRGFEMGASAPSGQLIGGLKERRELQATTGTFYPFSSSSDSGLVSFTPINRGIDFFDFFAGETDQGLPNPSNPSNIDSVDNSVRRRIGPTGWDHYSLGATQTAMRVEIGTVVANNNQLPTRLYIETKDNNGADTVRQRCTRNQAWRVPGQGTFNSTTSWPYSPEGDRWFAQSEVLPNGRPCITLDLEKLPDFLNEIGMDDVTINNSIWIGPNHTATDGTEPRKPSFPSATDDMALLIRKSENLSAYTNGLTIITPLRVYFADNFNDVPTTPPAGSGITGDWYPPVSVYAPEKRFGIQDTSGRIELAGQIGYLPTEGTASDVHPLDLKDGGTDSVDPNAIEAELSGINRIEDLPPVNSMNWLTVIEEIR